MKTNIQDTTLLNREEIAFLLHAFDNGSDNICPLPDERFATACTQAIRSFIPKGRISLLSQSPQPIADDDLQFSLPVAAGKVQCLVSPIDAAVIITAALGGKKPSVSSGLQGISLNLITHCCRLLSQAVAQTLCAPSTTAEPQPNTVPFQAVLQLDIRGMKAKIRLYFENELQADSRLTVATVRTRPMQISENEFRQWQPGTFIPLSAGSAIPAQIFEQKTASINAAVRSKNSKFTVELLTKVTENDKY